MWSSVFLGDPMRLASPTGRLQFVVSHFVFLYLLFWLWMLFRY